MKVIILFQIFFFVSVICFGQSIKMTTSNVQSDELAGLLYFENIQHYKVDFKGEALIGKEYLLVSKEIWNGVVTKVDTIVNSATNNRLPAINKNSFGFKVWAKNTENNFLKVKFDFPFAHSRRTYRAIDTDDYSLRDYGINLDIQAGQKFYALAYILPYEVDGWKLWCSVESSDVDIEEWGSHFNIEHYVIYEMLFN